MEVPTQDCDVLIMGGGLAGLTLALQLRKTFGDISVTVIERRSHPVPESTHKVGESCVEIGAHYFSTVLGLRPHLEQSQLRKFGFRFFFSEGRRDFDQVTEVGASRYLSVPSYQIDRGIFENYLGAEALRRGIRFMDGTLVRSIELSDDDQLHNLTCEQGGRTRRLRSRWLIDACGRAGLLKRKLSLMQSNSHHANAIWFRINHRIDVDQWSTCETWRNRCDPPARWLSTNHLMGTGYWVWLIPLASGSHSVGIVSDPRVHALESMDSFGKAMTWLETFQPRLFDELDGKRHLLQDFAFMRKFSYGCKQVFSAQRWALTGEAGLFLDPFYSPGSDFIAISNTYITELIALDRNAHPLGARAQLYDQIYHSFYESTLALYTDQYALFGDAEVLPVKVVWDYTYYWGILSQFFFQGRLTDLAALAALREELNHCKVLNVAVQNFLRQWSLRSRKLNAAVMHDQAAIPWFAGLNRGLLDNLDDKQFQSRVRASAALLRRLAHDMMIRATSQYEGLDASELRLCLSTPGALVAGTPESPLESLLPAF